MSPSVSLNNKSLLTLSLLTVILVVYITNRDNAKNVHHQHPKDQQQHQQLVQPEECAPCFSAIKTLHSNLDDDNDGEIDNDESENFIKEELSLSNGIGSDRHRAFHLNGKDNSITFDELWQSWKRSQVHNWTVQDTIDWLINHVELPQYVQNFLDNSIDGSQLPRLAVAEPQFFTHLGITSPKDRHKIILKSTDAVLFGPPKVPGYARDVIVCIAILFATAFCYITYSRLNQSQMRLKSLQANLESSQRTEDHDVPHRIGYWWSEKKSLKLNIHELETLLQESNCHLVKINLDKSLEEQGPFSVITHKLSDIIVKADQGDTSAKRAIQAFENYIRKHPEITVLDPLDNVRTLLDRYNQYRLIEESGLAREDVVFTPPFVHLTSINIDVNRGRIKRSKVTFPFVCKPILAHGSTAAHQMCIIFNEAGLKDVKPPCVAQTFVNHNARLFKLFVIKDKYYVIERPSLKNFQAGDAETVFFYSHDISKPNSSSSLTELDEKDQMTLNDMNGTSSPCRKRLDRIVEVFSEKLGLTFYGIDIIIENGTSRYAIIDMNTFPGYDGVDNFLTMFKDVILEAIPPRGSSSSQRIKVMRKATDTDSGIEST